MSVRRQRETVECDRCRGVIDMEPSRAEELQQMHVEVLCRGCQADDLGVFSR